MPLLYGGRFQDLTAIHVSEARQKFQHYDKVSPEVPLRRAELSMIKNTGHVRDYLGNVRLGFYGDSVFS